MGCVCARKRFCGAGIITKEAAVQHRRSVQAAAPEVVGDDDVGDGVEYHLDVIRVCGTGHVTINFFVG